MNLEARPGGVFAGCKVERQLGRGGMGAAYLATRVADGRKVVLKLLLPELARDPQVRERFLREARAQLKAPPSPHVVQVLGVHDVDGTPVLELEYAQGRNCVELLSTRGGRLQPLEGALIARDVARGLAIVHAQGLVHRDIKPENVIVGADGVAKILDFGLAKDVFLSGVTQPGQLLGTSYYMAPERWEEGTQETARSDLFSLGVVLYGLVVGRPPFVGGTLVETAELIAEGVYAPMRDAAPETPDDLERVVAQLLMTDPAYRHALAEEVAQDLERVVGGRPPKLPCLVVERHPGGAAGRRLFLVPGLRWSLGRDAGGEVVLDHPTVSRKHAELRRAEDGFRLCDLKSSAGTFVGDARLTQPRLLQDGDLVRLGEVALRFSDPRRQARAFAVDLRRAVAPAAAVELLLARRDPRALVAALERARPDARAEARAHELLSGLVGVEVATAARRAAAEAEARARADLPAAVAAMAGVDLGADPAAWLSWWARARASLPVQVDTAEPPPRLSVEVLAGLAAPRSATFDAEGVVFVGRDEKCHIRLLQPDVARLRATLLRLHRRVVVVVPRDEPRDAAAFLAPDEPLALGDVRLALRADDPPAPPPAADGLTVIDPASFAALEALAHPAVTTALVALQREATWPASVAAALFEDPAAARAFAAELAALLRRRAEAARPTLARLLGCDASEQSPGGWEELLAAHPPRTPQVAPAGWLRAQ